MCCIAIDEEAYIDEFVDYHLGLGFNKIFVYDNSEYFEMKYWWRNKKTITGRNIDVIHYPGHNKQGEAYLECAKRAKEYNLTWAAFFDVDEFLVLKKHDSVDEFLSEHVSEGSIGVNWFFFEEGGKMTYEPLPVTKRFLYRQPIVNQHIKSIVRLEHMDMSKAPHVHFPYLLRGTNHDTNGKSIDGPFNEMGPADVAVLHHYHTKSFKEYVTKRKRGRADEEDLNQVRRSDAYVQAVDSAVANFKNALVDDSFAANVTAQGCIYDNSAWTTMKQLVPKYEHYDAFD